MDPVPTAMAMPSSSVVPMVGDVGTELVPKLEQQLAWAGVGPESRSVAFRTWMSVVVGSLPDVHAARDSFIFADSPTDKRTVLQLIN